MRQSNKFKTPIIFRIGVVLLCFMLISCSMMGGLYARYTNSVSAGDSARVAFFGVSASGNKYSNTFEVNGRQSIPYYHQLTVTNRDAVSGKISEVSLTYTIYIYAPDGLYGMDVTVSDATKDIVNSTNTMLVFKADNIIPPGVESNAVHYITFMATKNTVDYNTARYSIDVKVQQVD